MRFEFSAVAATLGTALILITMLSAGPALAAEPAWARNYADACDGGDHEKCLALASAYSRGEYQDKKFPKDATKAQSYIRKGLRKGEQACGRNDPVACYNIGILYFEGSMVETDFTRGLEMVQKACNAGYQKACVWLEDSGMNIGRPRH